MAEHTTPRDLRDFIERLRAAGELHEVTAGVTSDLEITEITDRVSKEQGPALLFSNVRGSSFPVLVNQFGSARRLAMAFGVDDVDEVAGRITELLQLTKPPKGLRAKLATGAKLGKVARTVAPRRVKQSAAPCQEVVHTGEEVDLDSLPILRCWPEDGGRYVTLPLVFTKDLQGNRNCGMYRVQQYDQRTCGMHWQIHKDGADAWRHMPPSGRLEVAVVIGADPIVTYSASCPLPRDIDEMVFAGFARRRRVDMVQCRTIDLEVPANAEFVLEGYVEQGELRSEGPFGDHTGYYSLADDYPVLHVTAITRRRSPVYCATVVGVPDHEDKWMGKATERIFLPLLQMVQHEVVDYDLPSEGVFHGCCILAIRKQFPGHALKAMHAIWGTALLSLTKTVVVVDADVDVHDYAAVAERVAECWDPELDTLFTRGPIDVLDHAPTVMGTGGKVGIDATRAWASEGRDAAGEGERARARTVDAAAFAQLVQAAGGANHRVVAAAGIAIVSIDKQRGGQARELLEQVCASDSAAGLKLVVAVDASVDVDDLAHVAFRAFGNTDPVRDSVRIDGCGILGFDATTKVAAEGYTRDWPADIVMTEQVKQLVDERWAEYGIPTPGARTLPHRGLAEGERRIAPTDRARGEHGTGNAEMAREGIAAASRG
jgi:4-hydroxy-3-polyprenylbenzoate decarboxylase